MGYKQEKHILLICQDKYCLKERFFTTFLCTRKKGTRTQCCWEPLDLLILRLFTTDGVPEATDNIKKLFFRVIT